MMKGIAEANLTYAEQNELLYYNDKNPVEDIKNDMLELFDIMFEKMYKQALSQAVRQSQKIQFEDFKYCLTKMSNPEQEPMLYLHYQENIPEHFKSDYEALEQVRLKNITQYQVTKEFFINPNLSVRELSQKFNVSVGAVSKYLNNSATTIPWIRNVLQGRKNNKL